MTDAQRQNSSPQQIPSPKAEPTAPKKGKRSYVPLIYLAIYLVNLVLVVALQCLFVHTVDGRVSGSTLNKLPFFSGCTILQTSGDTSCRAQAPPFVTGSELPAFVLYETATGEIKLVRCEWNLYFPRFAVKRLTATTIPKDSEEYIVSMPSFLGIQKITVRNARTLGGTESIGEVRAVDNIQGWQIFWAIVLLFAEALIVQVYKRICKQLKAKSSIPPTTQP